MDWTIDAHTAEALLMQYSEWLDGNGAQFPVETFGDGTHEDLLRAFLAGRNRDARPKVMD